MDDAVAVDSIGEMTFRTIRSDIIHGVLRPGDKLTLDRLRQHYEVSVGTLREVLTRLASEAFVVAEGQKGFAVAPASEADLRELGALRLLLEHHALALSLATGDLEWEGRVVAAHHKLAAIEKRLLAGESSRTPDWIRYDRSFHESLISACGSRSLMAMHTSVFDRFVRYHMLAGSFRGKPVADDHLALLEAALARDGKTAQRLLDAHVNKGIEHVVRSGAIGR
ncbi:GntR family transcriptional regulator [Devosia sp. Root413D1]|uniref:GntR family transcriptional regulator n=1 Tax=Devosia sp. Root413D1 TaxID=1736531 RepID=UPI0006F87F5A|nr:FCD domain-containing protein [Devosia sp. Root413D1]KQW75905.1 GntR family transcriptional regulator [Devosia sp. Root413D1]